MSARAGGRTVSREAAGTPRPRDCPSRGERSSRVRERDRYRDSPVAQAAPCWQPTNANNVGRWSPCLCRSFGAAAQAAALSHLMTAPVLILLSAGNASVTVWAGVALRLASASARRRVIPVIRRG